MNIFITNLSYHASMDFIKMLRRGKYSDAFIIGSSSYPFGYTSASHYVDKLLRQPELTPSDKYLNFIINTCKEYKIDLLFAIDEDEIKILSRYVDKIPTVFVIPSTKTIELFCDKHCANTAMKSLGFNIPEYITTDNDLKSIKSNKIISRKRISCASLGIARYDLSEKIDISKICSNDTILQEIIEGNEYTVDVFCDKNGVPLLIIPRIRIAIRGGTTHKSMIEKNDEIISLCKTICSNYQLPGFSNMQFIVEKDSQKVFFLEVNPRIGAASISSSLASVNFADLFIETFLLNNLLPDYNHIMNQVKWGAFVSRFYDETICEEYNDDRQSS